MFVSVLIRKSPQLFTVNKFWFVSDLIWKSPWLFTLNQYWFISVNMSYHKWTNLELQGCFFHFSKDLKSQGYAKIWILVIKIFRGIMPKVLAYFKRAKDFRKFNAKMCLINIALKLWKSSIQRHISLASSFHEQKNFQQE